HPVTERARARLPRACAPSAARSHKRPRAADGDREIPAGRSLFSPKNPGGNSRSGPCATRQRTPAHQEPGRGPWNPTIACEPRQNRLLIALLALKALLTANLASAQPLTAPTLIH